VLNPQAISAVQLAMEGGELAMEGTRTEAAASVVTTREAKQGKVV
jgi:hypothetical protein